MNTKRDELAQKIYEAYYNYNPKLMGSLERTKLLKDVKITSFKNRIYRIADLKEWKDEINKV